MVLPKLSFQRTANSVCSESSTGVCSQQMSVETHNGDATPALIKTVTRDGCSSGISSGAEAWHVRHFPPITERPRTPFDDLTA